MNEVWIVLCIVIPLLDFTISIIRATLERRRRPGYFYVVFFAGMYRPVYTRRPIRNEN
jgi:hypothetical protein